MPIIGAMVGCGKPSTILSAEIGMLARIARIRWQWRWSRSRGYCRRSRGGEGRDLVTADK
jgi:hypothetical protein